MKSLSPFTWVSFFLLMLAPISAIVLGDDCPEIVRLALDATSELCENTGRNQACYGHTLLEAQLQPEQDFQNAGDMVDVTAVKSLRLWPLEVETGVWGVA